MEVTRQNTPNFLKNEHFEYQGLGNVRFFGKFGMLCFLVTSVLRFAFCLINDELIGH